MKYLIKTYGCQFNYSDSERVSAVLEGIGFKPAKSEAEADLIIFNTCSIRQKAEDKIFGAMILMSALKKRKKNLIIGITGCMVRKTSTQKSEEKDKLLMKLKPVDFVFRIEDAMTLPALLREINPKLRLRKSAFDEFDSGGVVALPQSGEGINCLGRPRLGTAPAFRLASPRLGLVHSYFKINPKYSSRFQALVPIATGCDKFCAYCIVPYTRGRERSRPIIDILAECEKLVANGCKEITLLGQNVDSYGLSYLDRKDKRFKPLKPGEKIYFTRLLEKIDKLKSKGLARVRWTSPHPKDLTDDLIHAVATLKTQMPWIHLPVQAGSNNMLRRMNRPYTVEHYIGLIKKIRGAIPNCSISTDIIVGFCGETKKDFKDTLKLFRKIRWDMVYFAKYSMRKYTAAYRTMKDDVPEKEKCRRWREVNKVLKECSLERNKIFVGKIVQVLVERCQKGICEGMSEHFKRTQFPVRSAAEGKKLIGKIVPVKVTKALEWNLVGKLFPPNTRK